MMPQRWRTLSRDRVQGTLHSDGDARRDFRGALVRSAGNALAPPPLDAVVVHRRDVGEEEQLLSLDALRLIPGLGRG